MRIVPRLVEQWPKLAWAAVAADGDGEVLVYHGPMVEVRDDWCVEAVWAGGFADGDFDRTDLVFGTGVRCRDGRVTFVSPGTTLGRLWHCRRGDAWYVSNSLPALMATAEVSLLDDYDYAGALTSICRGLTGYQKSFPAAPVPLNVVYFNNLVLSGNDLVEAPKPDAAPAFRTYEDYHRFLTGTAQRLAANMASPQRTRPVVPLVALSSGYDSAACAVVAKHVGCEAAVTFRQSTSLWRGSDSGEDIASQLGLACRTYPRVGAAYPLEETIWAVVGRPGVLNWTLFDYPEPLCCLFTGCHGDKVWDLTRRELPDPFVIPSVADLGIGEFRLFKGAFHCPVPFWGMRHLSEVRSISCLEEMKPWTLDTAYDRPIPRRIAEDAGIARGTFAVLKKNTSHEATFLWPYSPASRAGFEQYLKARGVYVPPRPLIGAIRHLAHVNQLVSDNILKKLGLGASLKQMVRLRANGLLFQWANSELKKVYANPLKTLSSPKAGGEEVARPSPGTGAQIRLRPRLIAGWPKLAWVAVFADGDRTIEVLHGPMVETGPTWCVEAVWAGPFEAADFDRTDLIYGSGIRIRSDGVHFVSSATGVDRLWHTHHAGRTWIANSLPALLATSGLALRDDYDGYAEDLASVEMRGLRHYASTLPATPADLHLVYFRNLRYDGQTLAEVDKPCMAPPFPTFQAYHDFLVDTACRLGANLQSPARRHRVVPMSSISSGYDSPATAAIARHTGCTRAATIRQATSLWRGSDSGEEIALRLGLECAGHDRSPRGYRHTPAIWAAMGRAGGLNLTVFDYPEPLCLFFNGTYGDKIWDRGYHDVSEPVGDTDSMLGEFRLIVGMFHTVVPWWGIQRAPEIQAINRLPEMAPWTLGTRYDRPIPRRILEEAGVPRGTFARRKANASSNTEFLWPHAPEAAASFTAYLRRHGRPAPPASLVPLIRWVAKVDSLIHLNLTARLGIRWNLARWLNYSDSSILFRWANEELTSRYAPALAGGLGPDQGSFKEDVRNESAT